MYFSGKTTLAKSLSTIASTAAFDKNPQSKERGITLDLGFSSFQVDSPSHISEKYEKIQYTLVDCPGHGEHKKYINKALKNFIFLYVFSASLIRTIIGGAQIIDLMILVVDIVKGMQTQTAECLVIGEITCSKMMVVLNKVDLIPESKRESAIQKMVKKMSMTLSKTRFKDAVIVPVSAKIGGSENVSNSENIGIPDLIGKLKEMTFLPSRDPSGPFIFAVDHCFGIKGQGTVMTGTVLSGSILVNAVSFNYLYSYRTINQTFHKIECTSAVVIWECIYRMEQFSYIT